MAVFEAIFSLITLPAFVLGFIAFLGLLMQSKPAGDVLKGVIKTVLGQLILGVGIGALINALVPIQQMFEIGIPAGGFETFVTFDEAVVGAVQDANAAGIGTEIA